MKIAELCQMKLYLISSYGVRLEHQEGAFDVSHLGGYVVIQGLAWLLWVIHQSHFKAGTGLKLAERHLENSSWERESKTYVCSRIGILKSP